MPVLARKHLGRLLLSRLQRFPLRQPTGRRELARYYKVGTQFTGFTSTKVHKVLRQPTGRRELARYCKVGTQFTGFTSTKVQIRYCASPPAAANSPAGKVKQVN